MKTYRFIIALSAVIAAFSCAKEPGKELPSPDGLVTIRACIPQTRAGAQQGFSWVWAEGDHLTVVNEAGESQVFNIKSGFSSSSAEFVGKAVEGEKFTILFPDADAGAYDWSKQVQDGNGSIAHLRYAATLKDVNDYMTFSFSDDWAATHGGSLSQNGVLKLTIALPDTVTKVTNVAVSAEEALFYGSNADAKVKKLSLDLTNTVPDSKHCVTAWMSTSWNEATVAAGTTLTVAVKTAGVTIEKDVLFTSEGVLKTGKVNTFDIDNTGWAQPSHYASGKGTAEAPWVIKTPAQIEYMKDDLADGAIRYFKLGADIDMTGINWTPLNADSGYNKQIDFDGDGHTISNFSCSADKYAGFFAVLYGNLRNVKFVNAKITATTAGTGILGGYGGTDGKPCTVSHVEVQGSITSSAGSIGGLFGNVREATIECCSADVIIETSNGTCCGGLFGLDPGLVTVRNCWTSGSVISPSSILGGICGDLRTEGSSIYNCYSTSIVESQFYNGGIVGRANKNQKGSVANNTAADPKNHIENCISWNERIKATATDGNEHYSNGTIVGSTALKNYLKNCWRKPDINFIENPKNVELGGYEPIDQADADPDTPLVRATGAYNCAYYGKAAATGKTLSQVAQEIGWDATIWDFSGELPKLK